MAGHIAIVGFEFGCSVVQCEHRNSSPIVRIELSSSSSHVRRLPRPLATHYQPTFCPAFSLKVGQAILSPVVINSLCGVGRDKGHEEQRFREVHKAGPIHFEGLLFRPNITSSATNNTIAHWVSIGCMD